MLEKMAAFFEARLDGYDEHMLTNIESAAEFYPFTASLLPTAAGAEVLDLGCGTGLELEFYCKLNPTARITGIDPTTVDYEGGVGSNIEPILKEAARKAVFETPEIPEEYMAEAARRK